MPRKKRKYEQYITIGFNDGKRIRKYIGADSKPEFERLKKKVILEAEKIRNPSLVTLGEYAYKWFEIYKASASVQTRALYKHTLDKISPIQHMQLKAVTSSDLQSIINAHSEHPRTCQKIKEMLVQIFRQAIKDGIIYPLNLAEDLSLPKYIRKEKRLITDNEMILIDDCDLQGQDRLYLETLRNTGMRPSEALALQWTDIDLDALEITVRRSYEFDGNTPKVKSTKTGKIRVIPITQDFANTLRDAPKNGILVFTQRENAPVSKSSYRKMSKRIMRAINNALGGDDVICMTSGLNMYSFRHAYATTLYYKVVKPGIISTKKAAQIMGHSEEMFLKTYTHIDGSKEKMDALRDILSQKGDKKETQLPQGDQRETEKAV